MKLKRTVYTFLLVTGFIPGALFAQQTAVNGTLYRKNTGDRIAQATITDLKTQVIMMSDELGGFSIQTAIGDTLLFQKIGYAPHKQVAAAGDVVVYLEPMNTLPEVTVKGKSTKQELNEVMGEYRSQGTFFNGKPPIWSFINSPLTGLYELFGKVPNEARRFQAFSKDEIEHAEITKRYNLPLVKKVTNLDDDAARKFMDSYTPSLEDLNGWNDYDLIAHIKKRYAFYQKNKGKIPVQKLY